MTDPRQLAEIEARAKEAADDGFLLTITPFPILALVAHVREVEREKNEAREAIAEANNSLFGSRAFFCRKKMSPTTNTSYRELSKRSRKNLTPSATNWQPSWRKRETPARTLSILRE